MICGQTSARLLASRIPEGRVANKLALPSAALKRRSCTVVLAAVEIQQFQGNVKGDGQECPSYTGCPQGLKPGFFF